MVLFKMVSIRAAKVGVDRVFPNADACARGLSEIVDIRMCKFEWTLSNAASPGPNFTWCGCAGRLQRELQGRSPFRLLHSLVGQLNEQLAEVLAMEQADECLVQCSMLCGTEENRWVGLSG